MTFLILKCFCIKGCDTKCNTHIKETYFHSHKLVKRLWRNTDLKVALSVQAFWDCRIAKTRSSSQYKWPIGLSWRHSGNQHRFCDYVRLCTTFENCIFAKKNWKVKELIATDEGFTQLNRMIYALTSQQDIIANIILWRDLELRCTSTKWIHHLIADKKNVARERTFIYFWNSF